MNKNIEIIWDDCGYTFKHEDKKFETDYCGFTCEADINVISEFLRYLGYFVTVTPNPEWFDEYCTDCGALEAEDCGCE